MTMGKLAIFTDDLTESNGHLMPWRTVLEIVSCWNKLNIDAVIFSASNQTTGGERFQKNVRIIAVPKLKTKKNLQFFTEVCRKEKITCLYYPRSWTKISLQVLKLEDRLGLKIIWYIPGAWYNFKHVVTAFRSLRGKEKLQYIAQSLIPRKAYVKWINSKSPRHVITMTDYVRDQLTAKNYPEQYIHAIPPGKHPLTIKNGQTTSYSSVQSTLDGRPYYLFFGPPQAIRGIEQVLSAFKKISTEHENVLLVCLFRSDKGVKTDNLRKQINKLGLGKRLICIWQSVSETDLDAFLKHCYAVLKPFLLVPSEIPLAVIETAAYGKPIITTGPDGTGLFGKQFGLMVPPGDANSLATAMLQLLTDKELYQEKCTAAIRTYTHHPTWNEVARQWLAISQ